MSDEAIGRRAQHWEHECDNCGVEHTYNARVHDVECGEEECAYCEWLDVADDSFVTRRTSTTVEVTS